MADIFLSCLSSTAWAPRDDIAPICRQPAPEIHEIRSNGSPGCYGGWDLVFPVPDSPWIRFEGTADIDDLERGLDSIRAALLWDSDALSGMHWEPVLATDQQNGTVTFRGETPVPQGVERLVLRLLMCWSATGRITWRNLRLEGIPAPAPRRWRLAAGGGPLGPGERSLKTNTETYLGFCREAAEKNVDLLCLPEVMLTSGLPSTADTLPEQAIRIPGPETEPFQEFCRDSNMVLCFSAWERRDELLFNTAMLIDRDGKIAGTYRKVHLASPFEPWWGVTPGHDFPVHTVDDARIAMNICMDSSVAESSRVPAMQGAEILCMPIMGDQRAVTDWTGGPSDFDIDRWRAIQSVHAMDNQLTMVISVNAGLGSCIVSPTGEILDMLQGRRRIAYADVDLSDRPRTWLHCTFASVGHWVRRQPAYSPLTDPLA